jgi:hypothetical protein
MSALPPEADIRVTHRRVCFGPTLRYTAGHAQIGALLCALEDGRCYPAA